MQSPTIMVGGGFRFIGMPRHDPPAAETIQWWRGDLSLGVRPLWPRLPVLTMIVLG